MKQKKPRIFRGFSVSIFWLFRFIVLKRSDVGRSASGNMLNQFQKMPLPFCVYILFSEVDHLLYIGFTTDLEERIKRHNSGGNKSTAHRRPLKLIFAEYYLFKEDALKREGYFKTNMGKRAIRQMLKGTLDKMGYENSEIGINNLSEETPN
jgi:putative endonuclease